MSVKFDNIIIKLRDEVHKSTGRSKEDIAKEINDSMVLESELLDELLFFLTGLKEKILTNNMASGFISMYPNLAIHFFQFMCRDILDIFVLIHGKGAKKMFLKEIISRIDITKKEFVDGIDKQIKCLEKRK